MAEIYLIWNTIECKGIVGSTMRTKAIRWQESLADAKGTVENRPLIEAIRRCGPDAFKLITLEYMDKPAKHILRKREHQWTVGLDMFWLNGAGNGYNVKAGDDYPKGHPMQTTELAKRMSNKFKGRHNEWNIGTHHSEETKQKISKSQKGIPRPWQAGPDAPQRSSEARQKMSEARYNWWRQRKAEQAKTLANCS